MDDVLGTGPELDGDPLPPEPDRGPGWIARALQPAALALSAFALSLGGLLGINSGVVLRLATALAEDNDFGSVFFSLSLTQAQVGLMAVAIALGAVALWRGDGERAWWEPVAGAAIVIAVLVAGVNVFAEVRIGDAGSDGF